MDYLSLTIVELHNALVNSEITPLELTKLAIEKAKADKNNAFEYICEKEAFEFVKELEHKDRNNLMWGIPFVIKDNFSTKDIPTTASCNILNGYVPIYSSEVYQRLINAGAIPIGKTTMDQLGMGGTGTTGHKGMTYNPFDSTHQRIIGGSSSGSASATAVPIVPLGIGSDTGDSVRKPASFAGLVGFKPTWGRISRYGLFPFACSLDHVGFFTRSVEDAAIVLELLAGRDTKDLTSSTKEIETYYNSLKPCISQVKIAIIDEIVDSFTDQKAKQLYLKSVDEMKNRGAIINHVSLDKSLCRALLPTYMIISCAEAVSNTNYLDGIKFGQRCEGSSFEEIARNTRTKGFSYSTKRRLIIGAYSQLGENQKDVNLRAQQCRRLIVNRINEILKDNDVIYLPSAESVAPILNANIDKLSDTHLIADNHLTIGNFAGLPSLTVPIGLIDNLPFGGNFTGRAFEEQKVLNCALALQQITGLKNLSFEGMNKK